MLSEWSNWSEKDGELDELLRNTPRAAGEKQMFRECALEFSKLPLDNLEQAAIQLFHLYVPEHVERLTRQQLPRSLTQWIRRQKRAWFSLWQWQGADFLDLIRGGRANPFPGSDMLRPTDVILARALPGGTNNSVDLLPCSGEILSPAQAQALIGKGIPRRDTRQAMLTAWAHREWLLQDPKLPRFHADEQVLLHVQAKPNLWREVRVAARVNLEQLHELLQALFGWEDRHLHRFELSAGRRYRTRQEERDSAGRPFEYQATLYETLTVGEVLRYSYNYLAGWELLIHAEREAPAHRSRPSPWCTRAQGHSPGERESPDNYIGDRPEVDPGAEINRRLKALASRGERTPAVPTPTLDHYDLSLLNPKQMMVACLLEAGAPLTWSQLLTILQHAGVRLKDGLRALRRAWNGDPVLLEDPDQELVYLNVAMLDYERELLELLLEARVRKRGAPRHLETGPFSADEFEYFFRIFSADGPELVGWELALALILEFHDQPLPWRQALLEVENRLGWQRQAEPSRKTSWYEVRGSTLRRNYDEGPWQELRKVLRETRYYRTLSLQETEHVQNAFEAYNRSNRPLPLQTLVVAWSPDSAQACWRESGEAAPRTGSLDELKAAAAPAQVLVAPHVKQLVSLAQLSGDGRRLIDLCQPHSQHWQDNLLATLGLRQFPTTLPEQLARYEEYLEYGRIHGYVLQDVGDNQAPVLHRVGWNPARLPMIHELLLQASMGDRPLRLLCHGAEGPIWHLVPLPDEGLVFRGESKEEMELGGRVLKIWQILRVHALVSREARG